MTKHWTVHIVQLPSIWHIPIRAVDFKFETGQNSLCVCFDRNPRVDLPIQPHGRVESAEIGSGSLSSLFALSRKYLKNVCQNFIAFQLVSFCGYPSWP